MDFSNENMKTADIQEDDTNSDICKELDIDIPETNAEIARYNSELRKRTIMPGDLFTKSQEWFRSFFESLFQAAREKVLRFKHQPSNSIIIAITCHGSIPCISETSPYGEIFIPEVIKIPEDIEIHKFNIAAPGTFTLASSEESNYYLSVINNISSQLLNSTIDIDKSQANDILSMFKNVYDELFNDHLKTNDPDRSYIHYSHKGYNYNLLKGGDTIINKYFTRILSEKQHNDYIIAEISNPVAPTPLNMLPDFPDLLEKVYGNTGLGSTDPFQIISVENIINYYRIMGITRIILFDFSSIISIAL